MKTILLSAIALIVLASCEEPTIVSKPTPHKIGIYGEEVEVVKIEGCEYFTIQYDRSMSMCHKGNCTNPIHKQ